MRFGTSPVNLGQLCMKSRISLLHVLLLNGLNIYRTMLSSEVD